MIQWMPKCSPVGLYGARGPALGSLLGSRRKWLGRGWGNEEGERGSSSLYGIFKIIGMEHEIFKGHFGTVVQKIVRLAVDRLIMNRGTNYGKGFMGLWDCYITQDAI